MLSSMEIRDLRCVANTIIPECDEFSVPGAGDEAIFADILASLGRDFDSVRAALGSLAALAKGPFADLDEPQQEAVMHTFHEQGGTAPQTLMRVTLQCYYRDERVVRSLGLEPGPPFPKGRALEQGDWSLLDPVRSRPKMWRDVPPR